MTSTWQCSSVSAAFPEEALTEQQINLNNPAVSSECESLESLKVNINTCTFQSENGYTHEGASNDLDAERRGKCGTPEERNKENNQQS